MITKEDIKDWTTEMICAKIHELENEYDKMQKEYLDKRKAIVDDCAVLQTALSNISVCDMYLKFLKRGEAE